MFFVLIMPKPKDLASETVAQIIGLKVAGHTIKEICELTGAGPTSVKKVCKQIQGGRQQRVASYQTSLWEAKEDFQKGNNHTPAYSREYCIDHC